MVLFCRDRAVEDLGNYTIGNVFIICMIVILFLRTYMFLPTIPLLAGLSALRTRLLGIGRPSHTLPAT